MPLADYAHWNEDAERVWWAEEGRHDTNEPPEVDDDDGWSDTWGCVDDAEHDTALDCIADGNFNERDGIWECDECARQVPEFAPHV